MTKKMTGLVYRGKENVSMEMMDVPELENGEALIKVAYGGICGSDVTLYEGRNSRVPLNTVIGHELSGTIAEINGEAKNLSVGDNVTIEPIFSCGQCDSCRIGDYNMCEQYKLLGIHMNGGFAEFVKAPFNRIYKLPPQVSLKEAALVEPLSVATHAVRQSRLKYKDNVLVIGGGPIGMFVAHVAKAAGANVIISDINDYRLGLAKQAGIDTIDGKTQDVKKTVAERSDGMGADVVFECAGVNAVVNQSLDACRPKGQVVIVASHEEPVPTDLRLLHLKEINMQGMKVYNFRDYRASIQMIASGDIGAGLFITNVLPLSGFTEGIRLMKGGNNVMKVLLDLTEGAR
ncbi:MAG TPA: alcohol dehydrogenase catalytic domain-containing protein [Anaerovoracaceae bacterium]|nr:alcohol dehydrogenase catalytic domain-containing protein [Anaerovoracaceae bacterium]